MLNTDAIQNQAFGLKFDSVGDLIYIVLNNYVFYLIGILLLVYLGIGGLQMMTAVGDPKKMQMAQSKITNALIGFVIVFVSYWVVSLVGEIFSIKQFGSVLK